MIIPKATAVDPEPGIAEEQNTALWTGTLTVRNLSSYNGCNNESAGNQCSTHLDPNDFNYNSVHYQIQSVQSGTGFLVLQFNTAPSEDFISFNAGGTIVSFEDASAVTSTILEWSITGFTAWAVDTEVSLSITLSSANAAPEFPTDNTTREVPENSPVGTDVGDPVTATDDDGDTLTYTLEGGADADAFDIVSSSGQIQTKAGVTYNFEGKAAYTVTVKADDSNGRTDSIIVFITITDVAEPPLAPTIDILEAVFDTSDSLFVRWARPNNFGKPDIESFDVQYRKGTTGDWIDVPQDVTGVRVTITGLDANSAYQVRVRATNHEGDGAWSSASSGTTNAQAEELVETTVPADWGLIPSGLGAGDRFRLIFISSTTRDGTATDIADYNTFVQGLAASGHADIQSHSSTFRVVGSTADVDARDNTATTYTADDKGVAIYWLGGNKVAGEYEDFYDGDWDDEANAKDESGSDRSTSGNRRLPHSPAASTTAPRSFSPQMHRGHWAPSG